MAFIRVSIDAPSLAYAVSLQAAVQFFICSHGFDTSESLPVCLPADQCDWSGPTHTFLAPKPVTICSLLARVPKSRSTVTRVFPFRSFMLRAHEAAYLVSLWQLDLERAETAEVPRWPPKDVLKS